MLHSILNIEVRETESVTNDMLVIITARAKGALAKPVKYSVFLDEDTIEEIIDVEAGTVLGVPELDLAKVTRGVPAYQHVDEATGAVHPIVCKTLSTVIQPEVDDADEAIRGLYSRLINKGQIVEA